MRHLSGLVFKLRRETWSGLGRFIFAKLGTLLDDDDPHKLLAGVNGSGECEKE